MSSVIRQSSDSFILTFFSINFISLRAQKKYKCRFWTKFINLMIFVTIICELYHFNGQRSSIVFHDLNLKRTSYFKMNFFFRSIWNKSKFVLDDLWLEQMRFDWNNCLCVERREKMETRPLSVMVWCSFKIESSEHSVHFWKSKLPFNSIFFCLFQLEIGWFILIFDNSHKKSGLFLVF